MIQVRLDTGSSGTINLSGSGSTITTTQEVTANTIALTTHTHTDTAGLVTLHRRMHRR